MQPPLTTYLYVLSLRDVIEDNVATSHAAMSYSSLLMVTWLPH